MYNAAVTEMRNPDRPKAPLAIPIALAAAILSVTAAAQQPWQRLQLPTAAEVQKAWQSPPPEYGPEPYYGLNGPVDQAVIERDLDAMKSLGYTAVTAQAGYGMTEPYLSEAYFKLFRVLVEQAKKRNMRVWIVDDAGYPSGFAGGKFSELHPELRMQALAIAELIPANGGDLITHALKPETIAVTAINQADGTTIQIPIANAVISWKAPPGKWTVVIVEHQFSTSPTRSDTNPRRVKDGTQSLEDYLDPAATQQYLAFTHEQYKKYLGDEFGKTIMGFRGDEPDYSIRGLPWTPKFFDRFQQLKGYDIRPFVATFFTASTPPTEQQRRARADFYDVFSQMFRDGFFKIQGDWCAANHLEYQVHLNHEEAELQLARSEGDFFRAMRFVQVPGIDSIWHQIFPDTISDFPRLAASASHVYGKPRAFTESFAAYRPEPTVTDARYVLNEQFVRGINLVETMYYPGSATAGGHGRSPYMNDPAYPQLLTYTRRMSYLLSMGRPAAAVALYLPTPSLWLNDEASDTAFVATEQLLSEHQIDFDIIGEDALAVDLKPAHGTLETLSGNRYKTIILPSAAIISQAALDRLHTFANSGGHVLLLGRTPSLISGKTILDARAATPADFSWASIETSAQLPPTPTPPAQPPASPPAPQAVPAAILNAVMTAVGTKDITIDGPDPTLKIMKRRLKDSDVYLLFNEGPAPENHAITFLTDAQMIETWDPEAGAVSSTVSTRGEGTITVQLSMKPYATTVLLIR